MTDAELMEATVASASAGVGAGKARRRRPRGEKRARGALAELIAMRKG